MKTPATAMQAMIRVIIRPSFLVKASTPWETWSFGVSLARLLHRAWENLSWGAGQRLIGDASRKSGKEQRREHHFMPHCQHKLPSPRVNPPMGSPKALIASPMQDDLPEGGRAPESRLRAAPSRQRPKVQASVRVASPPPLIQSGSASRKGCRSGSSSACFRKVLSNAIARSTRSFAFGRSPS